MAIEIHRQLTIEQYVKLFSNPVSGLICTVDSYNRDFRVKYHTKNIRYSKSMLLKALNFWFDQLHSYYLRVYKIRKTSLIDVSEHIVPHMINLRNIMNMVEDLPSSFLFSHRYIELKSNKYSTSMSTQLILLNTKYPILKEECKEYGFQEGTLNPCYVITTNTGIEFTVFPNEYPYIPKSKITRVGKTDKNNIYVLFGAQKGMTKKK